MIAERDEKVQRVLAAMLVHLGYRPIAAEKWDPDARVRPVAALLGVRLRAERDGPAVLRALRDTCPGLPCVFVCTNPAPYSVPALEALGRVLVLQKPVTLEGLQAALGVSAGG